MSKRPRRAPADKARVVIDIVIELLDAGGYDSVHVGDVAKRAQISLVTLYSLFSSRDELIVSAVERWLNDNVFTDEVSVSADKSLGEALIELMSTVMKPWEQHPRMLEALFRARESPGSHRLRMSGYEYAATVLAPAIQDADPDFVSDLFMILWHVQSSVMAGCARGDIPISDALPILERTVNRLTSDQGGGSGRAPRSWPWRPRRGVGTRN
jgi:TetR/AcrR family transcriptional regulator, cholesterol catabolism regulator